MRGAAVALERFEVERIEHQENGAHGLPFSASLGGNLLAITTVEQWPKVPVRIFFRTRSGQSLAIAIAPALLAGRHIELTSRRALRIVPV
jgi:hypothetical protein